MKKEKARDVGELFHHFANKVFDEEKRSGYHYKIKNGIGELYKNSYIIAIAYFKRKVLVVNNFSTRGAFGNGYCSYDIIRAFNNKGFYNFTYNDLTPYSKHNDNFWFNVIFDKIYSKYLIPYLKKITIFRNNPDATRLDIIPDSYELKIDDKEINKLCRRFNVKKSELYNHKINIRKWFSYYNGNWSGGSDIILLENTSIKDILKIKLSKSELERIDYLKWFNHLKQYITRQSLPIRRNISYFEIYNDPKLKKITDGIVKIAEDKYEVVLKRNREQTILKEQKRKEEETKKQLENINKWLNNKIDRFNYCYSILCYLRISKDKTRVETIYGASVPIEDAKKLYKLYIKVRNESNMYTKRDRIGNYILEYIDKNVFGWYIKIGCHLIYDKQIDDFINRNKLNWNEE